VKELIAGFWRRQKYRAAIISQRLGLVVRKAVAGARKAAADTRRLVAVDTRKLAVDARIFWMETRKWFKHLLLLPLLARFPARLAYRLAGRWTRAWKPPCELEWQAHYQAGIRHLQQRGSLLADLDPAETVRRHDEVLAHDVLDGYRLARLSAADVRARVSIEGIEALDAASKAGRGVFLCMGHYGRTAMLGASLGLSGYPVGMLTNATDRSNTVLSAADRAMLTRKMNDLSRAVGGPWIKTGSNTRTLIAHLKAGGRVCATADLYEANPANRFFAPFLGGVLAVPNGLLRVARSTNAAFVYGRARSAGERVEIQLTPIDEPTPEACFTEYLRLLSADIEKEPRQWWLWAMLPVAWEATRGDNEKPVPETGNPVVSSDNDLPV